MFTSATFFCRNFACRSFLKPLPSAIRHRIRGLKVSISTAEIVVGIEEVEVDIVDDEVEVEIGEKHGIAGDDEGKVGDGIANEEIGEKHDAVGERGVEVYVGVVIEVLVVEVLAGSRTFSVKEHIRRILLPSEIAYIPAVEVAGCEFHHSPCHHSP